jgi:hypothetical protein
MTQERPITRADIETKLRQLRGEVDSTAKAAVPIGLAVGAAQGTQARHRGRDPARLT